MTHKALTEYMEDFHFKEQRKPSFLSNLLETLGATDLFRGPKSQIGYGDPKRHQGLPGA